MSNNSVPVLSTNPQPAYDSDEFRDYIEAAHDGSLRLHNRYANRRYRVDSYSHEREQSTLTEITGNTGMITMNYMYIASRLHFTKPIDPKQMRLDQC